MIDSTTSVLCVSKIFMVKVKTIFHLENFICLESELVGKCHFDLSCAVIVEDLFHSQF